MLVVHNQTTGVDSTVWDVTIVAAGTTGAVWHDNSFKSKSYAYLLRADGTRTLDFIALSHFDIRGDDIGCASAGGGVAVRLGSSEFDEPGTAQESKIKAETASSTQDS